MPNPKPRRSQSTHQFLGMSNCLLLLRLQWRELESISRRRQGLAKLQVLKQMRKTRENCQCRAWILWDLGLLIRRRVEHCQLGWFQSQTILLWATCLRLRLLLGTPVISVQPHPSLKEMTPWIFTSQRFLHGESFPDPMTFQKRLVVGELYTPGKCLKRRKKKLLRRNEQDN